MGSNHPMGACASALPRTAMSPLAQRIMGSTTKGNTLPAVLLLADGTVFYGRAAITVSTLPMFRARIPETPTVPHLPPRCAAWWCTICAARRPIGAAR